MIRGIPFNSFSYLFIKFSFSKVSRPESLTRPDWRIQAGARFTPIFSIIFSKHFVWFFKIFVFISVATRIPDSTRLADPSRSPVYSDIFNYLIKTFCLYYSILDFLIRGSTSFWASSLTFTFNKMHLQNNVLLQCLHNV